MVRARYFVSFLAAAVMSTTALANTDGLRGADALIAALAGSTTTQPAIEITPFNKALADYNKAAPTLRGEEAANAWLKLVDAYVASPSGARSWRDDMTINAPSATSLLMAIPAPDAWPKIITSLQARTLPEKADPATKRREIALKFLAAILAADENAIWTQADAMAALERTRDDYYNDPSDTILRIFPNKARTLSAFEKSLSGNALRYQSVQVPALSKLTEPAKSDELIRQALLSRRSLNFIYRPERDRAKVILKEVIGDMKRPVWELVEGPDDAWVYELLAAKFLKDGGDENPESQDYRVRYARTSYVISLVAAGKQAEALAIAKELASGENSSFSVSSSDAAWAREKKIIDKIDALYAALLKETKSKDLWENAASFILSTGEDKQLFARLDALAQQPGFPDELRNNVETTRLEALLKTGAVDEAITTMQAMIEKSPNTHTAIKLLKLAVLLKRQPLADSSAQVLAKVAAQPTGGRYDDSEIVEAFSSAKKFALAEDFLISRMKLASNASDETGYFHQRYLGDLICLYGDAGRLEDVHKLLVAYNQWPSTDLLEFTDSNLTEAHPSSGVYIARALAAKGDRANATALLEHLLIKNRQDDVAYEAMIDINGSDALPFLKRLQSVDSYEERPLIWQAELLRRDKKIDEAEKLARQAITIDPSDGEMGHGLRMKGYAVLGAILKDKGDAAGAAKMSDIVKAIRMSERADDLYEAGLAKQAIDLYIESLKVFADAYCIEARLAIKYLKMGNAAAAAEHYRRAYELMPDSFGFVESHCFGCEGAFNGSEAQNIAEKIFTDLAQKQPHKPQIFYLLGYLRDAQDRPDEALQHYQKAVALDRDYLNAWKRIAYASRNSEKDAKLYNSAVENLVRLDPLNTNSSIDLDYLRDPKLYWVIAENHNKRRIQPSPINFKLPVTAKAANDDQGAAQVALRDMLLRTYTARNLDAVMVPAHLLTQHQLVRIILQELR